VIAPSGSFLYTVDSGALNGTGSSITTFSIDARTGCLTVLQTSLTDGSPLAIAIDRTGHFLYVAIVGPFIGINAYSISTSVTLTRQSASDFSIPPPPIGPATFFSSLAADPVADLLFAVEGRSGTGDVDVLAINSTTGALTQVAGSLTGGDLATDIAIDPLGTAVFIANVFGGVGAYSVASDGALTAFTGSPFGPTNPGPGGLAIDPSGKFLYGTNGGEVVTFSIGSGTLTQLPTMSLDGVTTSIAVVRRQ